MEHIHKDEHQTHSDNKGLHHHHHEVPNINTAFVVGIVLNTCFVTAEVVVGFSSSSLALLSDAGHNATDVFSLLLSMFAFKAAKAKANDKYTYGYKRATYSTHLLMHSCFYSSQVQYCWRVLSGYTILFRYKVE